MSWTRRLALLPIALVMTSCGGGWTDIEIERAEFSEDRQEILVWARSYANPACNEVDLGVEADGDEWSVHYRRRQTEEFCKIVVPVTAHGNTVAIRLDSPAPEDIVLSRG